MLDRYYEGLFLVGPLELKREFQQLDLTKGEPNECISNSPSRKAYGRVQPILVRSPTRA